MGAIWARQMGRIIEAVHERLAINNLNPVRGRVHSMQHDLHHAIFFESYIYM